MSNLVVSQILQQITGFSQSELFHFIGKTEYRSIPAKTILLRGNEVAHEVYFILRGCMRLYYEKEGEDVSAYFFTENMFAGAYVSFISQQPSRLFMETIEDCEVISISHVNFKKLFVEFPRMTELMMKILEERFVSIHELFTSHILDSPEERYLNLMKERPDLLNRIPQHHIATFLGITSVSLSRIRSRISKKQINKA